MSDINYPLEIEKAAIALHEAQVKMRTAKQWLDDAELVALEVVAMARDDKGKPTYTNETERKIAHAKLLQENKPWRELLVNWQKVEVEKVRADAYLERLRREHSEHKLAWQDEIATKQASDNRMGWGELSSAARPM